MKVASAPTAHEHTSSLLTTQMPMLAQRAINRTLRTPVVLVPTLMFPLMFFAVNSQGLADIANLPGFPTPRFLDFALAMTFMQSSLFATNAAGSAIAQDIESGFLNRLSLTPMRGAALVASQLAGAGAIGAVSALVFLIVGLVSGVEIQSGLPGMALIVLTSSMIAMALASLGVWLALRTGSGEEVQALFPLLFASFFLSSLNLPRELIEIDWFRTVATLNPISYLVEGIRSLIITGWDPGALLRELLVLTAILTIGITGAARNLSRRMGRT